MVTKNASAKAKELKAQNKRCGVDAHHQIRESLRCRDPGIFSHAKRCWTFPRNCAHRDTGSQKQLVVACVVRQRLVQRRRNRALFPKRMHNPAHIGMKRHA